MEFKFCEVRDLIFVNCSVPTAQDSPLHIVGEYSNEYLLIGGKNHMDSTMDCFCPNMLLSGKAELCSGCLSSSCKSRSDGGVAKCELSEFSRKLFSHTGSESLRVTCLSPHGILSSSPSSK